MNKNPKLVHTKSRESVRKKKLYIYGGDLPEIIKSKNSPAIDDLSPQFFFSTARPPPSSSPEHTLTFAVIQCGDSFRLVIVQMSCSTPSIDQQLKRTAAAAAFSFFEFWGLLAQRRKLLKHV